MGTRVNTISDVGGQIATSNPNDSSFLESYNRGYVGGDEEVMFVGQKIEKD